MNKKLKTLIAWMLVWALMGADIAAIAATLTLPESLKTVEKEAFYGNTSIDKVVLPDELETIESKAFANSSLKEINLPASLETIADDAFADTTDLTVSAEKGTDAYDWAVEKGHMVPPSSDAKAWTYKGSYNPYSFPCEEMISRIIDGLDNVVIRE